MKQALAAGAWHVHLKRPDFLFQITNFWIPEETQQKAIFRSVSQVTCIHVHFQGHVRHQQALRC